MDTSNTIALGALLTGVLALWLRTQVTAPVAADSTQVPKATVSTR